MKIAIIILSLSQVHDLDPNLVPCPQHTILENSCGRIKPKQRSEINQTNDADKMNASVRYRSCESMRIGIV